MLFPCTAGSAPPPEEDAGRAVLELPPVPEHAAKHRHRHKHKASERIKFFFFITLPPSVFISIAP